MTDHPGYAVGITEDLRTSGGGWFGELPRVVPGAVELSLGYVTDSALASAAADVDALIVNHPVISRELIGTSPRLRHVARFGAGFDNVDLAACSEQGVIVTNTPEAVAAPVASAVLCLLLALAHRLPQRDRMVRDGEWSRRMDVLGRSLSDATVGIIGFGSIARSVVALLAPFGSRVIVHHPRRSDAELLEAGVEPVTMDELLATSDFVVPLVPATAETHHLIGARELGAMRTDAYLVNVSRGVVVDEPALVDALRSRSIGGAALDVFEAEPPEPGNPLLGMPDVILAPHSLAWSDRMLSDIAASAWTAVEELASGTIPASVVNPDALAHPRWDGWTKERP